MNLKETIITTEKESTYKLKSLLEQYKDKLVVVVATTCSGKTTFLKSIKNAHDMDNLMFWTSNSPSLLSKEEKDYVCQKIRTQEIGRTMTKRTKERIKVEKGKPLFWTVVLDSDIIINLKIEDELLKERTEKRNVDFKNAKNMQKSIENELKESDAEVIEFVITKEK